MATNVRDTLPPGWPDNQISNGEIKQWPSGMSLSEKFNDDALFLDAIRYRVERCGNFPDDMVKDQARLIAILDNLKTK